MPAFADNTPPCSFSLQGSTSAPIRSSRSLRSRKSRLCRLPNSARQLDCSPVLSQVGREVSNLAVDTSSLWRERDSKPNTVPRCRRTAALLPNLSILGNPPLLYKRNLCEKSRSNSMQLGGSARKAETPKQERSLLILAHVCLLENQKVETFLNAAFFPL